MTLSSRALHILVAATFVFVNLVCPCASAYNSAMEAATVVDSAIASNCHDKSESAQAEQVGESVALGEHQDCSDCTSALALSCEPQDLATPAPQFSVKLLANAASDADYSAVVLNITAIPPPVISPSSISQCLPVDRWAAPVDSPIRRHDRTLV